MVMSSLEQWFLIKIKLQMELNSLRVPGRSQEPHTRNFVTDNQSVFIIFVQLTHLEELDESRCSAQGGTGGKVLIINLFENTGWQA